MSEEKQYDRVITTQLELHALVSEAIVTGELNLKNCQIDVDFNLVDLLRAFSQEQEPCETSSYAFTMKCPFSINSIDAIFTEEANFSSSTFSGKTDFRFATFTEKAEFGFATFTGEAEFGSAIFTGEANFNFATFTGEANFSSTTFTEKANFYSATFTEKANFYSATFTKKAYFSRATFTGEAFFYFVTFTKEADFGYAKFTKHSSFKMVKILENATLDFNHITTHDYLGIVPIVFYGEIIIKDPTLESDRRSLVLDFKDCYQDKGKATFEGVEIDNDRTCLKVRNLKEDSNVEVHFQDCGFYGKNVAFTNMAMKQVIIQGGNDVAGMTFYRCEWESDYPDVWFNGLAWLVFRGFKGLDLEANSQKIADAYAQLKVRALEAGDIQLSNDFHFWHQWHQRKRKFWNPFYLHTSAYGLSVGLPLLTFGICFLLFSLGYMWNLHSFTESNLVSLSASVPFVFNDVEVIKQKVELIATQENWWFYPLYILQHLIQGYLLFQIGAAIRNKVKR